MFSFLEEIAKLSGLPFDIFNENFKVINFGNKVIYIEQFKNIISFENFEIVIKLSHGVIKITGENLKIKNMNLNTIVINGNIKTMEIS